MKKLKDFDCFKGKTLKSIYEYQDSILDIYTEGEQFRINLDSRYIFFDKENRKDALYCFLGQEIKHVIYNPCLTVSRNYGTLSSLVFVFKGRNHFSEEGLLSFDVRFHNDRCRKPKVNTLDKDCE